MRIAIEHAVLTFMDDDLDREPSRFGVFDQIVDELTTKRSGSIPEEAMKARKRRNPTYHPRQLPRQTEESEARRAADRRASTAEQRAAEEAEIRKELEEQLRVLQAKIDRLQNQ